MKSNKENETLRLKLIQENPQIIIIPHSKFCITCNKNCSKTANNKKETKKRKSCEMSSEESATLYRLIKKKQKIEHSNLLSLKQPKTQGKSLHIRITQMGNGKSLGPKSIRKKFLESADFTKNLVAGKNTLSENSKKNCAKILSKSSKILGIEYLGEINPTMSVDACEELFLTASLNRVAFEKVSRILKEYVEMPNIRRTYDRIKKYGGVALKVGTYQIQLKNGKTSKFGFCYVNDVEKEIQESLKTFYENNQLLSHPGSDKDTVYVNFGIDHGTARDLGYNIVIRSFSNLTNPHSPATSRIVGLMSGPDKDEKTLEVFRPLFSQINQINKIRN